MEHFNNSQELQQAVTQLPPQEFAAFRNWFLNYDQQTWDSQIEQHAGAGRLNDLLAEAKDAHSHF